MGLNRSRPLTLPKRWTLDQLHRSCPLASSRIASLTSKFCELLYQSPGLLLNKVRLRADRMTRPSDYPQCINHPAMGLSPLPCSFWLPYLDEELNIKQGGMHARVCSLGNKERVCNIVHVPYYVPYITSYITSVKCLGTRAWVYNEAAQLSHAYPWTTIRTLKTGEKVMRTPESQQPECTSMLIFAHLFEA